MDFTPVSGDFRDAFNHFAIFSANSHEPHPIGRENGDSHSFVAFAKHLIRSGWFGHDDEVLAMDKNAAIHASGDAGVEEDLLWNTIIKGRALSVRLLRSFQHNRPN